MAKIFSCSCCGADVTSPQFFKGKVYGWTCIKKVNPNAKQQKTKWVELSNPVVKEASYQPAVAQAKGYTVYIVRGEVTSNSGFVSEVQIQSNPTNWHKNAEGQIWVEEKAAFPKKY